MKILTQWLRSYLPTLHATDHELAEALTLHGIAVEGIFDLTPQHGPDAGSLFEMDITTNRVDAMNHYGIAREAAVVFSTPLLPLDLTLPETEPKGDSGEAFPIRVEAPDLCGRFTARVLRNITIAPNENTSEVAHRFRLLDQKQISNAVDATNYVTQAIGQPTHAFDLDKVQGALIIRRARAGEPLKTLDGIDRELHPDDLVIADETRALSLAGVMGGWDSMITPTTRNILVEAAWFDPAAIRRTSKRHSLHTDASHRFERGADFNAAPQASALVSRLILAHGGHISGPFVDIQDQKAQARTVSRPPVRLHMREVHRILGSTWGPTDHPSGISGSEATTILLGLGCTMATDEAIPTHDLAHGTVIQITSPVASFPAVSEEVPAPPSTTSGTLEPTGANPARAREAAPNSTPDHPHFDISLPSWRLDLEREIDLLEEIARVYGYNRFRNTLPVFTGSVREAQHAQPGAPALRIVRRTLLGAGLSEAISSTFVSAADANAFAPQPGTAVPMENPLSEEAGMLRPSLAPGMLTMLAHNLHRGVEDAALFELGTIFTGAGPTATDRIDERPSLAFGVTGTLHGKPVDFFAAKGITEALAAQFTSRLLYFDRFPPEAGLMPSWLHPGRSARLVMDGATIGFFGQLHPDEAARRKIKQAVILGELRMDRLLLLGLRHSLPRELSRFQPVRRDFSFLLPEHVPYGAVKEALQSLQIAELQSFEPAEVRRDLAGEQVAAGEYSLLLRTVFQSSERTLRDEDLQGWAQTMQAAVGTLGGRLRS